MDHANSLLCDGKNIHATDDLGATTIEKSVKISGALAGDIAIPKMSEIGIVIEFAKAVGTAENHTHYHTHTMLNAHK